MNLYGYHVNKLYLIREKVLQIKVNKMVQHVNKLVFIDKQFSSHDENNLTLQTNQHTK